MSAPRDVALPAPWISLAQADAAEREWGANCGPGALAGILGLTLEEVRPHMGDFEEKGYTNPTLMYAALDSLGVDWRKIGKSWPRYGLVRVGWEGPWTDSGSWMAAARHTHWIGTALVGGRRGVFDINCVTNGSGWVSLEDWEDEIAPWLIGQYAKANGRWHIANGIEILRRAQHEQEHPEKPP